MMRSPVLVLLTGHIFNALPDNRGADQPVMRSRRTTGSHLLFPPVCGAEERCCADEDFAVVVVDFRSATHLLGLGSNRVSGRVPGRALQMIERCF